MSARKTHANAGISALELPGSGAKVTLYQGEANAAAAKKAANTIMDAMTGPKIDPATVVSRDTAIASIEASMTLLDTELERRFVAITARFGQIVQAHGAAPEDLKIALSEAFPNALISIGAFSVAITVAGRTLVVDFGKPNVIKVPATFADNLIKKPAAKNPLDVFKAILARGKKGGL